MLYQIHMREVRCTNLDDELERHRALGFRLDTVFPADAPVVMLLSRGAERVKLVCGDEPAAATAIVPELAVARATEWHRGRAGMEYRDLIPGRLGGGLIASHIRVVAGGPVPDYVHYHDLAFQLIYCHRGWVRLVYEDQGEPFVLREGACVVQPPAIRHRVLESSPGLEVIELASPAVHPTHVEHALELPNGADDREWAGQRFWHGAVSGVAAATGDRVAIAVQRQLGARTLDRLLFGCVLSGTITLRCQGKHRLAEGDAFVVPARTEFALTDPSGNVRILEAVVASE
jgi:quercetin dioxygenase-like cupin family protein